MELHQIRYFLAAAETLNFTRAAERCNVSQPALTRAIQKLEEELGGPLFRRERNYTHLTDLGNLMRDHLSKVDAGAEGAVTAARGLLSLDKAPLNVGIMCTIGPSHAAHFFSQFQAAHPGIELCLHDVTPDVMTDGLMEGNLDCALLGLPVSLHDRFDTERLHKERMVAIFPPGHRFATMDAVPLKELGGERYLDRLNCEFRDMFFEILEERGIKITVPYRSEREDWIQNMVAQGMGVCLVPEYSVTVEGLQFRPVVEPDLVRQVEVVTVAGRQRSPALQVFFQEAIDYPWRDRELPFCKA